LIDKCDKCVKRNAEGRLVEKRCAGAMGAEGGYPEASAGPTDRGVSGYPEAMEDGAFLTEEYKETFSAE
jgi:hypothetical protein